MRSLLLFFRPGAAVVSLMLASCAVLPMTEDEQAVVVAAAAKTGNWTKVEDGKSSNPMFVNRSRDLAEVKLRSASHSADGFSHYIRGATAGLEMQGGKLVSRREWSYRGYAITEQVHDYGPGRKHDLRYSEVLMTRTPSKVLMIQIMGPGRSPEQLNADDLLKAILDGSERR